ncbi:uroporphyrinogen decarboxylase [Striga asiatica]|uniref:Uroporphyrinogen decarboxylase n=1 Tax=Striga asiatica TaxID=4170 RepID=A0A5A7QDX1_STRAF|nr:uroporphyrinogen decarboxylase [Striga asiatica]
MYSIEILNYCRENKLSCTLWNDYVEEFLQHERQHAGVDGRPWIMIMNLCRAKPYGGRVQLTTCSSLSHVSLFLKKPVFSHGQLYVDVSRVTTRSGLKILVCGNDVSTPNQTKNVLIIYEFCSLRPSYCTMDVCWKSSAPLNFVRVSSTNGAVWLHRRRSKFTAPRACASSSGPLLVKAVRGESVNRPRAWMKEVRGPVIQSPIRPEEDSKTLYPIDLDKLQFVGESLRILRKEVGEEAAVLGFVGSPWTIATHIVEGGTTRIYTTIKSMCHMAPNLLRVLLSHLTKAIAEYVVYQVESGVHCIQIFDSWGGQLPPDMWDQWSTPYFNEIVRIVKQKCPQTPLVLYINGNGWLLEGMKGTGVDVIGLDWTVDMADGRARLGKDISIQGNVDPTYLFSPILAITNEIKSWIPNSVLLDLLLVVKLLAHYVLARPDANLPYVSYALHLLVSNFGRQIVHVHDAVNLWPHLRKITDLAYAYLAVSTSILSYVGLHGFVAAFSPCPFTSVAVGYLMAPGTRGYVAVGANCCWHVVLQQQRSISLQTQENDPSFKTLESKFSYHGIWDSSNPKLSNNQRLKYNRMMKMTAERILTILKKGGVDTSELVDVWPDVNVLGCPFLRPTTLLKKMIKQRNDNSFPLKSQHG